MTLYLLPGFGWVMWKRLKRVSARALMVFSSAATFGVSAYAYLFIRAGTKPFMNWGDPSTLDALLAHITGKQYRVWMFKGMDSFNAAAKDFFSSIAQDAGWVVILFGLAGLLLLWRRDRVTFWFSLILVVFTLGYSFNYDIHDIETYYLLVHLVASILAAVGLWWLMNLIGVRYPSHRKVARLLPFIVVALTVSIRLDDFVPPDRESPEPFALDVLQSLDRNAAVLTGEWDFLYSPILALQNVRGIRPDVRMIDIHLLRDRSWYVRSVLGRFFRGDRELDRVGRRFLDELLKFESGRPFQRQVIQLRWEDFLKGLMVRLADTGPLYVDHNVLSGLPPIFRYHPEGYLLRAAGSDEIADYGGIPDYHPIGQKKEEIADAYRRFASTAYVNHGLFAVSRMDSLLARVCLERALLIDGSNPLISALQ